ncbi:MAG: acyl-coenzyme A synthetase/AMP-(fatty) acid ligase [Planctomycetota bacterium]|jgi:acyl-coenzyme A synthetase/AMP-(fatty) acid ligase
MPLSVADAFGEFLRADPAAPVAWTATGIMTRASVDQHAAAIGELLQGIPVGRRIGLSVRDGATFLAAFLAMARRSHAVILMDAADPRAPRLDLAAQLGATAVLVDEPELSLRPCGGDAIAGTDRAIKLTSGSTGEPTAIAVGDVELLADAQALEQAMGICDGDRVLAAVPMSFSYGVGNLLVPALARGRVLVLPGTGPLGLLRAMRVGEPTVLPAVPALLRALLQGSLTLPASMRLVMSAGAKLPEEVAVSFRERFGLPVHAFYGSTESGGACYDQTGQAAERGSVGRPIDGVSVTIADGGRVRIASKAVGRLLSTAGNEPEAPENPHDGGFVAPDLGAFVAGELVLHGRAGTVFDVGGHKVDPREVEDLIASLPQVVDVGVVPFCDEQGRAICAAVVAGRGLNEEQIRRHCARVLPPAKVPRRIVLVDELPCTSRGKLSREALQELLVKQSDLESEA